MFNKKILVIFIMVILTTFSLNAQTIASVPVGVADNNVGQVLLNPLYYAVDDYTTDITVTNTRNDAAVKAKVIFRSNIEAHQVLKFLLYLSPGDAWHGRIMQGVDGQTHMLSSDDSMRNAYDTGWANDTPVDITFDSSDLYGSDSTAFGHMEVFGVYAAAGKYQLPSGVVEIEQGMSKDDLKDIFDIADANSLLHRNPNYTDCAPADINLDGDALAGNSDSWTVSSIAPCSLQIIGKVDIRSASDSYKSSFYMTALGVDHRENFIVNVNLAQLAGYVITNPYFNTFAWNDSPIGSSFGSSLTECGLDTTECIEHGLAKEHSSHEADSLGNIYITFPTKYRHKSFDVGCGMGSASVNSDEFTPPFQPTAIGEMNATYDGLANNLIVQFQNAVNYFDVSNITDSGWVNYQWLPVSGCSYTGAPVIGFSNLAQEILPLNKPYSLRELSQTKYGVNNLFHMNDNNWINPKEDEAPPLTITHALYPFQIGTMSGDVDGYKWGPGGLLFPVEGIKREEEDTRQPLILIHGWQADKNSIFDYLNRDPVELSKNTADNDYDAEGYWWTFLRYFSTNDELKKKYKIYLYQYPSYKHITFNARMLSNMLYEVKYIRDWISQNKKISILAHSMGGLVSRSFLEEHGGIWYKENNEWQLFKSGQELLDKLITLDTPHHGSPAAVYPWVDVADDPFLIKKDLYSPGALDLWWDGYDGAYHAIQAKDNTDLVDCIAWCGIALCDVNELNSMRPNQDDITSFDTFFRDELNDYDTVFKGVQSVFTLCVILKYTEFYSHPNPWLTHLNTKMHIPKTWQDKYIFYGGYNDSPLVPVDSGDKLSDDGVYDLGDNFWITGVWKAGYLNDSPVPVTSSFFDTVKTDCLKDLSCMSETNLSDWPVKKVGMFWSDFVWDETKNIFKATNEGFQIRFFKDYNHDRMLHGAYKYSDRGYMTSSTPDACYQPDIWAWELVSNNELRKPCEWEPGKWEPRAFTGFREAQYRLDYIKDTGTTAIIDDMTVYNDVEHKDNNWKSTLEYEPLFLMLNNDLLGLSSQNNVPWIMLLLL